MKQALVTQSFGNEWKNIIDLTRPRMEAYCKRHSVDFILIDKPLTHPAQYSKSAIGNIMATKHYDQVTFVDADVLIAADCPNIADDAGCSVPLTKEHSWIASQRWSSWLELSGA